MNPRDQTYRSCHLVNLRKRLLSTMMQFVLTLLACNKLVVEE